MATGMGKLPSRLRLSGLSRGDDRQRQTPGTSEEATPLNVRAQVDFSTVFWDPEVRRKRVPDQKFSRFKAHHAPEDHIKRVAMRLAFVEKIASVIAKLVTLFATTVILGGFSTSLAYQAFWSVIVIVIAEAIRIFTRSHELEWQLISSRTKDGKKSRKPKSSSDRSRDRPVLPTTSSHRDIELESSPRRIFAPASSSKFEPQVPRPLSMESVFFPSRTIPVVNRFLNPAVTSALLYILQVISAITCIALAIWNLSKQEFCLPMPMSNSPSSSPAPSQSKRQELHCSKSSKNISLCMNVFFSVAIAEGSIFLLEKLYFEYQMTFRRLLSTVQRDLFEEEKKTNALLESKKLDSWILKKFYYSVYTMCLKGSVLDGLDVNLIAFALQWLQSDDLDRQLHGARVLNKFVSPPAKEKNSQAGTQAGAQAVDSQTEEALRRLGRTPGVLERLVEILFWNSEQEMELVCEIASVVKCLVAYDRNWSRFAVVPGALDAVVSILLPHSNTDALSEAESRVAKAQQLHLQLMGVKILRCLCQSYANSLQIGETRGLLSILVIFMQPHGRTPRYVGDEGMSPEVGSGDSEFAKVRWKIQKCSLQVLFYLAANKSNSGGIMRQQIGGIVSVLKNLRDTIERCGDRPHLQVLSMELLHHLAIEDNVRGSIGATGGTIRLLFDLFRQNDAVQSSKDVNAYAGRSSEDQKKGQQDLARHAGKVLSRLMIQNKENCVTLLTLKDKGGKKPLVQAVMTESFRRGDDNISVSAAEILCSITNYADEISRTEMAKRSGLQAMENILETMDVKSLTYEASLGVASCAMQALPAEGESDALRKWIERAKRGSFLSQLVGNLHHSPSTSKVPKIRRYSLEVMIALVERDDYFRNAFARLNLKAELEQTLDNISEVENFILFSGLMAYARHSEDIKSLVLRCMAIFDDDEH